MRFAFHNDLNICSLSWYPTLMNFVSFLLWSGIKPAGDVSYSWFDAQRQCLGRGLTTEKDKSDQPYWTGVYRRLTPWINILGHYLLFSLFLSLVNISFYIIFNFKLLDFFVGFFFSVCITRVISFYSLMNMNVVRFVWRMLFRFNRHSAIWG